MFTAFLAISKRLRHAQAQVGSGSVRLRYVPAQPVRNRHMSAMAIWEPACTGPQSFAYVGLNQWRVDRDRYRSVKSFCRPEDFVAGISWTSRSACVCRSLSGPARIQAGQCMSPLEPLRSHETLYVFFKWKTDKSFS
jgi:hypothetical protein